MYIKTTLMWQPKNGDKFKVSYAQEEMQYSIGLVVIAEAWVVQHGAFMFQGIYIAPQGRGIPLFNGLPIASIKKKDEINLVYSLSSA